MLRTQGEAGPSGTLFYTVYSQGRFPVWTTQKRGEENFLIRL